MSRSNAADWERLGKRLAALEQEALRLGWTHEQPVTLQLDPDLVHAANVYLFATQPKILLAYRAAIGADPDKPLAMPDDVAKRLLAIAEERGIEAVYRVLDRIRREREEQSGQLKETNNDELPQQHRIYPA